MNILPINNNINSNNTSFQAVRVLGAASSEVKQLVGASILKKAEQDYFVLTKTCRVSPYDYNHPAGTILYQLKLVKKPKTFLEKLLLKLGCASSEYITDGYRSERGVKESLTDKHLSAVMRRLG